MGNDPKYLKRVRKLPVELQRTLILHIVTHGVNSQNAGFHLNCNSIRQLAILNAGVELHGYQDKDDDLDFSYDRKIKLAESSNQPEINEYAYFYIYSEQYLAEALHQWLNLPIEKSHSRGDFKRTHPQTQQSIVWEWTSLKIGSGLNREHSIPEHLTALLNILESQRTQIWQVAQDYHIDLGITATGHVSNPHHRLISPALIARLAALGTDLNIDFYFND